MSVSPRKRRRIDNHDIRMETINSQSIVVLNPHCSVRCSHPIQPTEEMKAIRSMLISMTPFEVRIYILSYYEYSILAEKEHCGKCDSCRNKFSSPYRKKMGMYGYFVDDLRRVVRCVFETVAWPNVDHCGKCNPCRNRFSSTCGKPFGRGDLLMECMSETVAWPNMDVTFDKRLDEIPPYLMQWPFRGITRVTSGIISPEMIQTLSKNLRGRVFKKFYVTLAPWRFDYTPICIDHLRRILENHVAINRDNTTERIAMVSLQWKVRSIMISLDHCYLIRDKLLKSINRFMKCSNFDMAITPLISVPMDTAPYGVYRPISVGISSDHGYQYIQTDQVECYGCGDAVFHFFFDDKTEPENIRYERLFARVQLEIEDATEKAIRRKKREGRGRP